MERFHKLYFIARKTKEALGKFLYHWSASPCGCTIYMNRDVFGGGVVVTIALNLSKK